MNEEVLDKDLDDFEPVVLDDEETIEEIEEIEEAPEEIVKYDVKEEEAPKRQPMSKKAKQAVIIAAACAAGVVLAAYAGGAAYYSKHFYKGTKINGFDCSNMTIEEAREAISKDIENYTYELKERDSKSEYISGSEVELRLESIGNLNTPLENQKPSKWFFDKDVRYQYTNITVTLNEDLLYEKVNNLECVAESKEEMGGAEQLVKYVDGVYVIDDDAIAEENGSKGWHLRESTPVYRGQKVSGKNIGKNIIGVSRLFECVKAGMYGLYKDMNLDAEKCYVNMSEELNMKQALETMNRYVSTKISYQNGDEVIPLDGGSINEWVSLDSNYNVYLNEDEVANWVSQLAAKYNTIGKNRSFKSSSGGDTTVGGGDYGWRVDVNRETKELCEIIRNGETVEREPVYSQKALTHGAVDFGNTYVEINIGAQHLWFYKNGELVVSSDMVSGNPYAGNATPTGIYKLKYKEKDSVLVGEDYRTPVSYWMPFNGGVGMHDASWRGSFGGGIYKGGGSHGCINLPTDVAAKIYGAIEPGTAVVVY